LVGRNKQNVPKSTLKIIVKSKIKEVNSCEKIENQRQKKNRRWNEGRRTEPEFRNLIRSPGIDSQPAIDSHIP
jgi:hypothetical protein